MLISYSSLLKLEDALVAQFMNAFFSFFFFSIRQNSMQPRIEMTSLPCSPMQIALILPIYFVFPPPPVTKCFSHFLDIVQRKEPRARGRKGNTSALGVKQRGKRKREEKLNAVGLILSRLGVKKKKNRQRKREREIDSLFLWTSQKQRVTPFSGVVIEIFGITHMIEKFSLASLH